MLSASVGGAYKTVSESACEAICALQRQRLYDLSESVVMLLCRAIRRSSIRFDLLHLISLYTVNINLLFNCAWSIAFVEDLRCSMNVKCDVACNDDDVTERLWSSC